MSLSGCIMSVSLPACMMSARELGCVSVAVGCQAIAAKPDMNSVDGVFH